MFFILNLETINQKTQPPPQKPPPLPKNYLRNSEEFVFLLNLVTGTTVEYHNFVQSCFNINKGTFYLHILTGYYYILQMLFMKYIPNESLSFRPKPFDFSTSSTAGKSNSKLWRQVSEVYREANAVMKTVAPWRYCSSFLKEDII